MSAYRDGGWRDELAGREGTDPSSATETGGGRPLLVGNNIENPGNVDDLRAAAEMFGWACGFVHDARHPAAHAARIMTAQELVASGATIVALENATGAENLFEFRPPKGRLAVVAGNERTGIAREVMRLADRVVQIPNASAQLNTVNVAAAAAIALHHMSRWRGSLGAGRARGRPDVLFAAPTDAIATGTAVRSAACFGWAHVFIDDRHHVWFETDRVTRSLGRGAARRGRNPIRVIPARGGAYEEVCVIAALGDGEPLRRADLTLGPRQLVVIPDERAGPADDTPWTALGERVRRVRVEIERGVRAPFRLVASIALAEIARQLGSR